MVAVHIVMIEHKVFRNTKVGAIYVNPDRAEAEVERLNKANRWNNAYYITRHLPDNELECLAWL